MVHGVYPLLSWCRAWHTWYIPSSLLAHLSAVHMEGVAWGQKVWVLSPDREIWWGNSPHWKAEKSVDQSWECLHWPSPTGRKLSGDSSITLLSKNPVLYTAACSLLLSIYYPYIFTSLICDLQMPSLFCLHECCFGGWLISAVAYFSEPQ